MTNYTLGRSLNHPCFSPIPRILLFSKFLFWGEVLNGSGEGYGNPLQYSCLENPMDGGAW